MANLLFSNSRYQQRPGLADWSIADLPGLVNSDYSAMPRSLVAPSRGAGGYIYIYIYIYVYVPPVSVQVYMSPNSAAPSTGLSDVVFSESYQTINELVLVTILCLIR